MKGPIVPGAVPAILSSIYLGRRTGMLRFIQGAERRSVRFMSGHIVYGEASVEHLRLGEVLVAAGRLDPAVLRRAAVVVQRERKRMGAVLMDMGILDENGLEEALALHVRSLLASVFSLREGAYTFQEQDPEAFLDDDWPLAISTTEAVLAAVRSVRSREDVSFALGDQDRTLVASDDPLVLYQRMDLGPDEALVLSHVDGALGARAVLGRSPLDAATSERSLLALLCTGLVEHASDPADVADASSAAPTHQEIMDLYQGLGRRSHHEILRVAPDASAADIKAAYFRLAKRYHPDIHLEPGLTDLRDKLETVFLRLGEAYRALSEERAAGPRTPSEGGGPGGGADFEDMLRKGREWLAQGRTWEAIGLFEAVARGGQGRIRTRARVLLGRGLLKLPDRERVAETELREALREDPTHVEAHYLLGVLYRRRGLSTRAATMLRRALDLEPGHRLALAELDALAAAPPPVDAHRAPRRA